MKRIVKGILFIYLLSFADAYAQDIDTMIPRTLDVTPNIVLIIDNSKTMVDNIEGPKGIYNNQENYGGPATPYDDSSYYYSDSAAFNGLIEKTLPQLVSLPLSGLNQPENRDFKDELEAKGYVTKDGKRYYTGNYLNWYYESRFNFTKRSLDRLIKNRTHTFNFSLIQASSYSSPTAFNGEVFDCGQGNCTSVHIRQQTGLTCKSAMERALLETSAYFKDERSIYGRKNYSTTIRYWCQPNAVVVVSDGLSTWTGTTLRWPWEPASDFVDGGVAGDYLDDVAEKLYSTDLRNDLQGIQNVKTFTAGFVNHTKSPSSQAGLKSAASRGGGEFAELIDEESLESFLISVRNNLGNSTSGGLTIPVSRDSKSYSGEYAYLSMFKKISSLERWVGNIKKFRILADSSLSTTDIWTGNNSEGTDQGGVRAKLLETPVDQRKIYTNKGTSTSLVEFIQGSFTSQELTAYELSSALIDNIRCGGTCVDGKPGIYALGDIIHFLPLVTQYKKQDGTIEKIRVFAGANDGMLHCFDDETGVEKWAYIPDDQLKRLKLLVPEGHSNGTVSTHSSFVDGGRTIYETSSGNKLLIFGERRGGNNYYALNVTNADTPQLAYKVNLESDTSFGQSWTNPKVVPVMYGDSLKDVFWIGGGYDEANQERENGPATADTKGKGVYPIDAETGQKLNIIQNSSLSEIKNCILDPVSFNPGYASNIENISTNEKEAHSRLYACDMSANLWGFRDDAIPDDSVQVRSTGRKDGEWILRKIFESGTNPQRKVFSSPEIVMETFVQTLKDADGKVTGYVSHKGEYIYFGTGDREDPTYLPPANQAASYQDRFYAIKNYWLKGSSDPVRESDLVDVTADEIQMTDNQALKETLLSFQNKGWYIRLENTGEKVVSSPLVYNGMLFFTTYTPAEDDEPGNRGKRHRHRHRYQEQNGNGNGNPNGNGSNGSNSNGNGNSGSNGNGRGGQGGDPCEGAEDTGIARIYCLNYRTGEAALDFDEASTTEKLRRDSNGNYLDSDGRTTDREHAQKLVGLHKNDRSLEIGTGMPGEPQLFFPKSGGTQIIVGVNNNMEAFSLPVQDMHVFYWREKQ